MMSYAKNLLKWPYAEGQTVQMQRLVLILASHIWDKYMYQFNFVHLSFKIPLPLKHMYLKHTLKLMDKK